MSGYQKTLRITSISLIIFAGVAIFVSIVALATGSGAAENGALAEDVAAEGIGGDFAFSSIVGLIQGGLQLVAGIVGLWASGDPQRIGSFYWLSIVNAVLALFAIVLFAIDVASGAAVGVDVAACVINAILSGYAFHVASKIRALDHA